MLPYTTELLGDPASCLKNTQKRLSSQYILQNSASLCSLGPQGRTITDYIDLPPPVTPAQMGTFTEI